MFMNWCLRFMYPSNYALLYPESLVWRYEHRSWETWAETMEQKYREFPARYLSRVQSVQTCEVEFMCYTPVIPFLPTPVVELTSSHGALSLSSAQYSVLLRLCSQTFTLERKLRSVCSCSQEKFVSETLPLIIDFNCNGFNCCVLDYIEGNWDLCTLSKTGIYWKFKAHGL